MLKISQKGTKKLHLTAEQKRIVRTRKRAVEVLAYAGTGKSSTLKARVKKLLMRGARPQDILVLTFSKEGVRVLKGKLPDGVAVRTMHSYALSLLKPRPKLPKDKQLNNWLRASIDKELDRLAVGRREPLIERLGTPTSLPPVQEILDMMAATGRGAKELALYRPDRFGVIQHYATFFDRLAKRIAAKTKDKGYIRYGDMIGRAVKAIKDGAKVPFKHLLVDEWQDSSVAQGQLVNALAKRMDSVMVLGDPHQAIFGFAGATPMRLKSILREARTYPLTISFRLTQADAALATAFVRQSQPDVPEIQGRSERGHRPKLLLCPDPAKQAGLGVDQVKRWIEQGVAPSSIAILARTKRSLRGVEQGLLHAGLNSTAVNTKAGIPLKEIMSVFKVFVRIENLRDHPQLKERLSRLLKKEAKREVPESTMKTYCRKLCDALASNSVNGLYATCCGVILGIGFGETKEQRKVLQIELNRWRALSNDYDSLEALREEVRLRSRSDKVQTKTVHSAKGGEWDYVVVLNVANGSMPHYTAHSKAAMDEERSVFYVAITRAKKQLVLVEAEFDHPDNQLKGRSPFVKGRSIQQALRAINQAH